MIRVNLLALLALSALVLVPGGAAVQASDAAPCTIAIKGDNPVARACREGGIPKARRTMKELVRNGKAKGMQLECTDCHTAIDEWKLNQGATDKFRKLLEINR